MASYDGEIRIKTRIDASTAGKGLATLENRISKTAAKITALQEKLDRMDSTEVKSDLFKDYIDQIKTARDELDALTEARNNLKADGANNSDPAMKSMIEQAADLSKRLDELTQKRDAMLSNGTAYTSESNTSAGDAVRSQIDAETSGLDRLKDQYDETANAASSSGAKQKSSLKSMTTALKGLSSTAGKAADKLSGAFHKITSIGGKAFSGITSKVKNFASTLTSGFSRAGDQVEHFGKRIVRLASRVFVFSVITRAFRAMVSGISDAMTDFMKYDDQTAQSVASLKTALTGLQYGFVSAFAPIINAVIPYLSMLISYIASAVTAVGQFFAAFTGATTYKKLTTTAGQYASTLGDIQGAEDGVASSAKKATSALAKFDDLDVLQNNNDASGGGGGGGSAAPELISEDIPSSIQKMADKAKSFWEKFWNPLQKSWDRCKGYLETSWNNLKSAAIRLIGDIADDFITVWNSDTMAHVFDNILLSFGDIMQGCANLINNFADAWERNQTGLQILQDMATNLETITGWLRKCTEYFRDWSEGVDFSPLLTSLDMLLTSLNKVADFMGGVMYDVWVQVLKYVEWFIETGLPELNSAISDIIEHIDWSGLRENLDKIWEAGEHIAEAFTQGAIDAFHNLGIDVADFVNSKDFSDFCDNLAKFINSISAEDVEKLLTGIGEGILQIVEALVKWVNSKPVQDFLTAVGDWYNGLSDKDIANLIEDLAKAFLIFKGVQFAAGFIGDLGTFVLKLQALKTIDLGSIAEGLKTLKTSMPDESWFEGSIVGCGAALGIFDLFKKSLKDKETNDSLNTLKEQYENGSISLEEYTQKWKDFTGVTDDTTTTKLPALSNAFTSLSEATSPFFDSVKKGMEDWSTTCSQKGEEISATFSGIGVMISSAQLVMSENFTVMTESVSEWATTTGESISGWFAARAEEFETDKQNVATWIKETGANMQTWLEDQQLKFDTNKKNFAAWLTQKKTDLATYKKNWDDSWDKIGQKMIDTFKKIPGAIKGAIKDVLSSVETLINGAIDGINGILSKLGELSAIKGIGELLGIGSVPQLSHIAIPGLARLANGGITTGRTLAEIGEAGREAVLPLESNTDWMYTLADVIARRNGSNGGNTSRELVMEIDGTEFARVTLPYYADEENRLGISFAEA